MAAHPSVMFYTDRRSVELPIGAFPVGTNEIHVEKQKKTYAKDATVLAACTPAVRMKEFNCFALHTALLPPSMVDVSGRDDAYRINEELYSKSIASSDGCELLRENWFLLLHLLLPFSAQRRAMSYPASGNNNPPTIPTSSSTESKACSSSGTPFLFHEEQEGSVSSPPQVCDLAIAKEKYTSPNECYHNEESKLEKKISPISSISCRDIKELQAGLNLESLRELNCPNVFDRIHYSIITFLRFYGWRLHDDTRGELDRHLNWRKRYALLGMARKEIGIGKIREVEGEKSKIVVPVEHTTEDFCSTPEYGKFDFYTSGLPHLVESFLGIGFSLYAIHLVEFIIDEMKAERLTFLYSLVKETLLPALERCRSVDASHMSRLRRKLRSLVESDSE